MNVTEEQKTDTKKQKQLLEAPVRGLILKLAVPTILSMLVTTFYNMADTFFVSQLVKRSEATSATAAIGIVFSIMALIQAVGFFFGQGSANYISRVLGAGEQENAELMASTGFFCALIAGCVLIAVGFPLRKPISFLLGSTQTAYPYVEKYLTVILFGAPIQCGTMVINNQLRFQGKATFAAVGIISGAVLNCILDPIFIPIYGIRGAAIATVIGQIVSFALLLLMMYKSKSVRISLSKFKPKLHYLGQILNGGMPSLCRQGVAAVAMIILNHAAKSYGDYAISAMTVCSRIILFMNAAMIGYGQGFQPVCGFNYGAKKYNRVKEAFWFCVRSSFLVLTVMSAGGAIFAENLVRIFTHDPAVIRFGVPTFRYMCYSFPLNAWIVMSNMCMQTMGKGVRASLLALARQGLTYIPIVLFLPMIFGAFGLQSSQMWSDILTFIIAVPMQISVLKELKENHHV